MFQVDGVNVGLLICEDAWFEEPARTAKTAQSRLIHYEMAGRYSLRATRAPERGAAAADASCGAGR